MWKTAYTLAKADVQHAVVLASRNESLAEVLEMNKDIAEAECGETDSEFGYYYLFPFNPKSFSKFIEGVKKDAHARNLLKLLDESIEQAKIDIDKPFVAIVCVDENGRTYGRYYDWSRGRSEWKKIEEAWEEIEESFDDSEDFDPETDEVDEGN